MKVYKLRQRIRQFLRNNIRQKTFASSRHLFYAASLDITSSFLIRKKAGYKLYFRVRRCQSEKKNCGILNDCHIFGQNQKQIAKFKYRHAMRAELEPMTFCFTTLLSMELILLQMTLLFSYLYRLISNKISELTGMNCLTRD